MFLSGAELTLHADGHCGLLSELAMLVEALDLLGPEDASMMDHGYAAASLFALRSVRGIRVVTRCNQDSG